MPDEYKFEIGDPVSLRHGTKMVVVARFYSDLGDRVYSLGFVPGEVRPWASHILEGNITAVDKE